MFPSCGRKTIEVAKLFSVTLFFEEPIGKHDVEYTWASCFQVAIDSKMSMVTLTVDPDAKVNGHKTNITIMADTGNIYAYILQVVEKPSRLKVRIKKEDAVFNLKKTSKDISKNKKIGANHRSYENNRTIEEYYRNKIFYHMHMVENYSFNRSQKKNKKGCLFLNDIKSTKNKVFIFLKLMSRGVLDFSIKNVKMCIAPKEMGENTSKKNEIEPIYYYKSPKRMVSMGREQHFALVFKKFAIENNETLCLHINEFNKNRSVHLIIDGNEMDKAKRF